MHTDLVTAVELSRCRPDSSSKLVARAHTRLRESGHVVLGHLRCDYHEGVLIVRGSVGTWYLKQVAQELLMQLPDVEQVLNLVEVRIMGSTTAFA